MSFPVFLEKIQDSMGPAWSSKYVLPAELFFQTMQREWQTASETFDSQTPQMTKHFIRSVRQGLLIIWDQNFV